MAAASSARAMISDLADVLGLIDCYDERRTDESVAKHAQHRDTRNLAQDSRPQTVVAQLVGADPGLQQPRPLAVLVPAQGADLDFAQLTLHRRGRSTVTERQRGDARAVEGDLDPARLASMNTRLASRSFDRRIGKTRWSPSMAPPSVA